MLMMNQRAGNYHSSSPDNAELYAEQQMYLAQANQDHMRTASESQSSTYSSSSSEGSMFGKDVKHRQNLEQEQQPLQKFDDTQELDLHQIMTSRNQNHQSKSSNVSALQSSKLKGGPSAAQSNHHLLSDQPITLNDLHNKRNYSFVKEDHFQVKQEQLPLIELTTVAGSNQNHNHSSSLLINSSLISHNQNSMQLVASTSSNPNQSQAIAGAMKALQQKLNIFQEQNAELMKENSELQHQLQQVKSKSAADKEKLGQLLHQQKLHFSRIEQEQRARIEDDFRQLSELKGRVESSTRALDKLMKENVGLRKSNAQLKKQLVQLDQDNSKRLVASMQELRENEMKLKKKTKKLQREKKELTACVKQLQSESIAQKDYYCQLITDLEMKLKEMINQNHQLHEEYQSFRDEQNVLMLEANQQLQELKQMLAKGQYLMQSKDTENDQLKKQLQDFQEEIVQIKGQLNSLQNVHQQAELMRKETENFVSEVVNVNEMLVKSIQKRRSEADIQGCIRRSHNTSYCYVQSQGSNNKMGSGVESSQPSFRERRPVHQTPQFDLDSIPSGQRNSIMPRQVSQQPPQLSSNMNSSRNQSQPQQHQQSRQQIPMLPTSMMKLQSLHPIQQTLSTITHEDQQLSKRMILEGELTKFQQKYDELLKDIASSKKQQQQLQQQSLCQSSSTYCPEANI